MQIEFKTPITTLNEYIKAERSRKGKYIASKIKRDITNNIHNICKVKRFELPNGRFFVHFTWVIPNLKQDPDNVAFGKKFVLDGMVNADVLLNDGMAQIGGFTDNFELDREAKFVYCRVRFELI